MPNVKISNLSSAATPLDGTEEVPLVQSGTTYKATTQDLADLALADAVLNNGSTPSIESGPFANRPLAGQLGDIYISTDTDEIYQYNGSNWDLLSGIVKTISSNDLVVDSTDPKNPTIALPYNVYTVVITQSGTSAPTVDYTLQNTFGSTPTFAYISPGLYSITLSNAWVNNKTIVFINPGYMASGGGTDAGVSLGWERTSSSVLRIKSKKTSDDTDTNGLIFKATLEIRVYNI